MQDSQLFSGSDEKGEISSCTLLIKQPCFEPLVCARILLLRCGHESDCQNYKAQPHHFLAVWSWASYILSACLLIYKVGTITVPTCKIVVSFKRIMCNVSRGLWADLEKLCMPCCGLDTFSH